MTDKQGMHGTLANVTTPAYRALMVAAEARGACLFCPPDPATNTILHSGEHWHLWRNPFGYKLHEHHIIIAAKDHVTEISQLTREMWADLGECVAWACREFNIPGGALVMRFGDPDYCASTIHHLHMHIQVPAQGTDDFAIAIFKKNESLVAFLKAEYERIDALKAKNPADP